MAGLQLRAGFNSGASYTPMTPAGAGISTSMVGAPPSIASQAFGIASGADSQRPVAGYGSVCVGVFALAALVYLWYSLPR